MGRFFNFDSPVFQALNKVIDMIFLNLLVVVSSLPLITVGAAQAALYDVSAKLMRNEGTIWACYWAAFRTNFRQATVQWLILLLLGGFCGYGLLLCIASGSIGDTLILAALIFQMVILLAVFSWTFPLQSRFCNPFHRTLCNALLCSAVYLPKTLIMAITNALPWAVLLVDPLRFFTFLPLWLLIWFTLTAHLHLRLLKKPFAFLESRTTT